MFMVFQTQFFWQLILAMILGGLIGLEREYKKKAAGFQNYSLVALGSCLFTIIAFSMFDSLTVKTGITFDPSRVINAIAIGMGFIGAGVVFHQGDFIEGLTTAAGLWLTAAIGVAVGIGAYILAFFSTILTLVVLVIFGILERKLFK